MTMFTPNPIVVNALRDADHCIGRATVRLEGIEMQWRRNADDRQEDYWRLQRLIEGVGVCRWDGPTELVPRPLISQLGSVITTMEEWRKPMLDKPVEDLKRALSILTDCADRVGGSDTGLAS